MIASVVSGLPGESDSPSLDVWAPLEWTLPGSGKPAEGCGDWVPRWACPGERKVWIVPRDCGRRECPTCAEGWRRREAASARDRIVDHPLSGRCDRQGIVSPAPSWKPNRDEFLAARAVLYEGLRAEGWVGGCVVYHPYRGCETAGYDVVGGHFHILGWKEFRARWEGWKDRGWVYKNIRLRRGETVEGRLWATLYYELGHAGIHPDFHSITWFGGLGYAKIPREKDVASSEPPECPTCGQRLEAVEWNAEMDRGACVRRIGGSYERWYAQEWPERLADAIPTQND